MLRYELFAGVEKRILRAPGNQLNFVPGLAKPVGQLGGMLGDTPFIGMSRADNRDTHRYHEYSKGLAFHGANPLSLRLWTQSRTA
jgi:hypothetical protein